MATDWDHLRPLVQNKGPSGFLNEARNLVPCCGPCNQSKSGAYWKYWMKSKTPSGNQTQDVLDHENRISKLERFEQWGNLDAFPIEQIIGTEKWTEYWNAHKEIEQKMKDAQLIADEIRKVVEKAFIAKRIAAKT